jgi:hypothetical protein
MKLDPAAQYANCEDANRLCKLEREIVELMKGWMGLGIQRQRKEALRMEMAAIRTRMADRIRLAFSKEKKSDGAAVTAAPDHAHDQADGNFGGGGFGGGCVTSMRPYYRSIHAIPPRPGSMERVEEALGETKPCPHELCYYNSRSKLATCVACGKKMTPPIYTADDRVFLASLRITLDDPAESGTM